jgi:hypothetical protein
MASSSPFIPGGSYQESSDNIVVTISATCLNLSQEPVSALLTFSETQLNNVLDIANENGVLTMLPGSGTPPNASNQFIPAGSYQNSSSNILITISANCKTVAGNMVSSQTKYSASQAATLMDIQNYNGSLQLIETPAS